MNKNDPIGTDEAKDIMLQILDCVKKFCENNGLTYYLAFGTLLGAVRHQGFIPWDNDIDIWMPRPDYNRLREIVKIKPISDNVRVLDYRYERTFPFLKAVDCRTSLKEHYLVTGDNLGLYIDIFPLDGLPNNIRRKKILKKGAMFQRLFSLANYRFNTGSNNVIKLIKIVCYPFFRLLSNKKICAKLDELCSNYDYYSSELVGNVVWGYTEKGELKREWFTPSDGIFEGNNYCIPAGYDEILKTYYGNYMVLPPTEKRIMHCYEAFWK